MGPAVGLFSPFLLPDPLPSGSWTQAGTLYPRGEATCRPGGLCRGSQGGHSARSTLERAVAPLQCAPHGAEQRGALGMRQWHTAQRD